MTMAKSSVPMRSVEEHRRVVASLLSAPAPVNVTLAGAAGRVLADDVVASVSVPPFDNSAMDGYAVRAADVAGASVQTPVVLPVTADIPAGRVDVPVLGPGTAHRIMTGAAVPVGADAVVHVEATDGGTTTVAIREARPVGSHVRRAGEDVGAGEIGLTAGSVLGAGQIGLLAALGVTVVRVVPAIRVLVLSTGSELVLPGRDLLPGQIYESNGPMLVAAIEAAGAQAELLPFVTDDTEQFRAVLDARLKDADLVVTTGGVSAGAFEVVKDPLRAEDVEFVKVAMQPGMPQGAGRYEGVPILTFPGTPAGALVSFEVFLRPALRASMGHRDTARARMRVRLEEPLESRAGRRQFRRGSLDPSRGTVRLVGPRGSHFLRSLANSDCFVDIAEDVTHLDAGAVVTAWLQRE
jgi:molybdopterin molybdotransferase